MAQSHKALSEIVNLQNGQIAGASPSDCFVSYIEQSLVGGFYFTAEMQSVYSAAPVDWAKIV